MTAFTLVIGTKRTSSWSLRAWLMLRQTGAPFTEVVIPLDRPQTRRAILEHSPSGRVPTLKAGDLIVWDSLAIGEYLHELFPEAGLWPSDPTARATARAVVAEMHAGFVHLRGRLPMDLGTLDPERGRRVARDPEVAADVARILDLWRDCRSRFGAQGPFLFGAYSAADAFYAPVVTRFVTYGLALDGTAAAYRDAVLTWPALIDWTAAASTDAR